MTAQLANVIDRLVSIVTAAMPAGVAVIDGDPPSIPTGTLDYLVIAGSEDPNDLEDRATAAFEWAGLGAKRRNENGSVSCVVASQSGDTATVPTRRRRVMELLAVIETAILADLSLAGAVQFQTSVNTVGMKSGQNSSGCYALLRFTVNYETRI